MCGTVLNIIFLLYKGSFGLGTSITVQRYISTLMISKKKGFTWEDDIYSLMP